MKRAKVLRPVVGWREWVALPDLGIDLIKAKIDTGARTSALHAFKVEQVLRDGVPSLRFIVHPRRRRRRPEVVCEAPLVDRRVVVSSNGQREARYVIRTTIQIAARCWPIELTLTDRDEMSFRMLLGRQALRRHLIVDPGSSYRLGKPAAGQAPE